MRSSRGRTTREALLDAAAAVIADEGWHGATARSIAGRADVPLGAVNYHFRGKDELLRVAVVGELHRMFATPRRIMSEARSLDELLSGMIGWACGADTTMRQHVLLFEAMAQARRDPVLGELLGEALVAFRRSLEKELARLVSKADASPPLPAVGAAFAAQCDGLFLHFLIEPGFPLGLANEQASAAWRDYLVVGRSSP